MTMIFKYKHFNTIIYTKQCCVASFVRNKPCSSYCMRESAKTLKNPLNHKLARNFKHMTIIFNSNHFNTTIYTKECCVPSFVQNKTKFELLLCTKVPKTLKNPLNHNLAHNFKHLTMICNSNNFITIIYIKQCRMRNYMQNKPSLNY